MVRSGLLILLLGIALPVLVPVAARSEARPADPESLVRAGEALYAEHCARCHLSLAKTTKAQRTASRLRSANRQFPAMTSLDVLSDAELAAIAAALKTVPLDLP